MTTTTYNFNTDHIDTYNKAITSTNLFGDSSSNFYSDITSSFDNYKTDIDNLYSIYNQIDNLNQENKIDEKLEEEKTKKKRELEINVYYIQKYYKQINILKQIIFICCLGLIGFMLFNMGFFSEQFLVLYIGVLMSILFIKVMYDLWDIYIRDYRYFDEYNFSIYGNGKTDNDSPELLLYNSSQGKNITKKCIKKI
jgi:hypothetical protein